MAKERRVSEIIKVPFHGSEVLVVQAADGERLIIKSLCQVLSLDDRAQRARIERDPRLATSGVKMNLVLPGSQGAREMMTIPRRKLAAFLYGIQPGMVKDELIRANLIALQEELEEVMQSYFEARVAGATKEDIQRAITEAVGKAISASEERHRQELNGIKAQLASGVIGEDAAQRILAGIRQIALYQSLDSSRTYAHCRKKTEEYVRRNVGGHNRAWRLLPRGRHGEAEGLLDDLLRDARAAAARRNAQKQGVLL